VKKNAHPLIQAGGAGYNIIGRMSNNLLTTIGDILIMLMIIGSGILFVRANVNYIPDSREDENE